MRGRGRSAGAAARGPRIRDRGDRRRQDKAKAEADALLARAQRRSQRKNAAITEMKNQVAELSIQIAERILRDKLADGAAQKALVEK